MNVKGVRRTDVVVHKFDLWQREGVIEAHEDGWLHKYVDEVHDLVPKEESGCPQAYSHSTGKFNGDIQAVH